MDVTEHQAATVCCPDCGAVNRAAFPEDVVAPTQYGSSLKALLAYGDTYQLLPFERLRELIFDLTGHALSEGALQNVNEQLFEILQPYEAQVQEQLAPAGLLVLPAKQVQAKPRPARLRALPLPCVSLCTDLRAVRAVTVEPVPTAEQPVWDATVAAYHPLGYQRAFGAHQRYWIRGQVAGETQVLGGFVFAAAAKALAVRDAWIGWVPEQRRQFRHRIVANSRYLLLPGVSVPHLASHALALATRRLGRDWGGRYGYEPVLCETFIAPPWRGTCYRAANWLHLGETAGRGRQDRHHANAETVKQVWIYPLVRDWRHKLLVPDTPPSLNVAADRDLDA